MTQVSTIGLDLAKTVFRVHGVDASGAVTVRRALRHAPMLAWFAKLPPCLVGMEACATAHYWARELTRVGHDVRLVPPAYAKGLRTPEQERCRGRGGDLRGGEPAGDALCRSQERSPAGGGGAAQAARCWSSSGPW